MTEIVNKDSIQKRDSKPIKNRSRFNNSYRLGGTYRFGEYAPTMVADCVPDDNHKIKVSHVVKSYTMKQPLMQDIQLKDDTFLVPLSALLPRNYEKFITIPNIGDDINPELVGTSVKGFSNIVFNFLSYFPEFINYQETEGQYFYTLSTRVTLAFKYVALLDTMLSSGSLCHAMGMPLVANAKFVDKAINDFFAYAEDLGIDNNFKAQVKINNVTYRIEKESLPASNSTNVLSVREFWNRIHDTSNWEFTSITDNNDRFTDMLADSILWDELSVGRLMLPDENCPYDLARFMAYQICCAHFYSNDKVDYIYSAELWRENLRSLQKSICDYSGGEFVFMTFSWNGIDCYYDECSAFNISTSFSEIANSISYDDNDSFRYLNFGIELLYYLFGYRRSLRFVDYFTGSRTRPLAVGDADINVVDGKINVVESIQKKWYIRLWSQIARVGHKMSEQMKGLFPGVEPSIDWHDPIWIHSNGGTVSGSEVDNTGSNQFDVETPIAVTSTLHGGSHGKTLNLTINDRYAIVLTITSFDISRFYTRGLDRDIMHVSRYDKFNPFLQFMGDQKLLAKELNTDCDFDQIFGYQGRYEEYKTRIDRAFGGLSNPEVLPAMVFLADYGRSLANGTNISPDYIRSYPCELDRFFIALSGWSLGTYFHFIMVSNDEIDSSRPMAYNPQIQ